MKELVCITIAQSFPAWDVVITRRQGHEDIKMKSQITATFSVGLCVKSEGPTGCRIAETRTIHVVGVTVALNFIGVPTDDGRYVGFTP